MSSGKPLVFCNVPGHRSQVKGFEGGFKGIDFMSEWQEEIDRDELVQDVRRERRIFLICGFKDFNF